MEDYDYDVEEWFVPNYNSWTIDSWDPYWENCRKKEMVCTTNSSMARKDTKAPTASKTTKYVSGKQKKKKWSKGKQNEKVNNMVLFDRLSYDKLLTEAPKIKLITPSTISDRFRVNRSLARRAIRELTANGLSKMVSAHSSQQIYTRATTVV